MVCPVASAADGIIRDVELSNTGTLRGRVTDIGGSAVPQSDILLRFQGKTIAVASSARTGQFAIEQVRAGLHEVVVAGQATPVRIWNCGTAPIGCPPEFCSEVPMMHGHPVAAIEGCQIQQPSMPIQQCTPTNVEAFSMVDIITLTSLGTSIAALVIAIDANGAGSNSLVSGSGIGSTGSVSTGDTGGGVASP